MGLVRAPCTQKVRNAVKEEEEEEKGEKIAIGKQSPKEKKKKNRRWACQQAAPASPYQHQTLLYSLSLSLSGPPLPSRPFVLNMCVCVRRGGEYKSERREREDRGP